VVRARRLGRDKLPTGTALARRHPVARDARAVPGTASSKFAYHDGWGPERLNSTRRRSRGGRANRCRHRRTKSGTPHSGGSGRRRSLGRWTIADTPSGEGGFFVDGGGRGCRFGRPGPPFSPREDTGRCPPVARAWEIGREAITQRANRAPIRKMIRRFALCGPEDA